MLLPNLPVAVPFLKIVAGLCLAPQPEIVELSVTINEYDL